jgi:hypothetical protein
LGNLRESLDPFRTALTKYTTSNNRPSFEISFSVDDADSNSLSFATKYCAIAANSTEDLQWWMRAVKVLRRSFVVCSLSDEERCASTTVDRMWTEAVCSVCDTD